MTEPTNDNPQLSLGAIIASLPAVKAARKANTMSRVHRRLIEPIAQLERSPRPPWLVQRKWVPALSSSARCARYTR
jgi:hypothetical protein